MIILEPGRVEICGSDLSHEEEKKITHDSNAVFNPDESLHLGRGHTLGCSLVESALSLTC